MAILLASLVSFPALLSYQCVPSACRLMRVNPIVSSLCLQSLAQLCKGSSRRREIVGAGIGDEGGGS